MGVFDEIFEYACDVRILSFSLGLIIPFLLHWIMTRKESYWKKKGVKYAESQSIFGAPKHGKSFIEIEEERYKKLGRVFGHFDTNLSLRDPALSVGDPNLLRDIMTKDFTFFQDKRNVTMNDTIMSKILSSLKGQDWRRVRSIVSPTFSTSKLKRVMSIFQDCSRTLLQNFKMAITKGDQLEPKRLYGAFTMDVIASAAFSTKLDSHNDPENEFVQQARIFFSQATNWTGKLILAMPKAIRQLFLKTAVSKFHFFKEVTVQIIAERKITGQKRNDFLQLLIDAATEVDEEDNSNENQADIAENYGEDTANHSVFKNTTSKRLSTDELVAQCVIFFLAGYHTVSSTLSFATYLLALNQDEQEKAFQEIVEVLKQSGGKLTYEALQKMKYLDNVISETLRLYPPAPRLERLAGADYNLGDTGITIPKGMTVTIPVYAIHRDPLFFSNPNQFIPNRFDDEKPKPYTYMPFGLGPRNCVGMRFALLEAKVGLVHVLSAFHIKRCSETKVPLEFMYGRALLQAKEIIVDMEIREDCPLKE